ncbi:MAG: type II toxin-antitoxin system HicA family toxin [bacterium]|nr:type II toxin-antitoxin system HicA family toxin [bacterium]MDZ4299756.1 type II toxin-antitoxin system HicA family toxin [Candidatus Sungbacteria bacterium]
MPKQKSVTPRQIIKLLEHYGFVLKRVRGSHHIFQHPVLKHRVIVPLHHKDIPKGTLHAILKQAGLEQDNLK